MQWRKPAVHSDTASGGCRFDSDSGGWFNFHSLALISRQNTSVTPLITHSLCNWEKSGKENALAVDSLCLPFYMRDTTWNVAYRFKNRYNVTVNTIYWLFSQLNKKDRLYNTTQYGISYHTVSYYRGDLILLGTEKFANKNTDLYKLTKISTHVIESQNRTVRTQSLSYIPSILNSYNIWVKLPTSYIKNRLINKKIVTKRFCFTHFMLPNPIMGWNGSKN